MERDKINEKLKNITGIVMRAASDKGEILIENAEKEKARIIEEREIALLKEAYGKIQDAIHSIEKESNELFSSKLNEFRQLLFKKREDITNTVFQRVRDRIEEYRNQDDYKNKLKQLVNDGINEVGTGKITVIADKRDFKIIEDFKKKNTRLSIKESTTTLLGGCIVINTERELLADNSFNNRLDQQRKSFLEYSGLNLEV